MEKCNIESIIISSKQTSNGFIYYALTEQGLIQAYSQRIIPIMFICALELYPHEKELFNISSHTTIETIIKHKLNMHSLTTLAKIRQLIIKYVSFFIYSTTFFPMIKELIKLFNNSNHIAVHIKIMLEVMKLHDVVLTQATCCVCHKKLLEQEPIWFSMQGLNCNNHHMEKSTSITWQELTIISLLQNMYYKKMIGFHSKQITHVLANIIT